MFCDQCNQAEATVFLTQIINSETKKVNFCLECAQLILPPEALRKLPAPHQDLSTSVFEASSFERLIPSDGLFSKEACILVLSSVFRAIQSIPPSKYPSHVSADQIAKAFQDEAIDRFGKSAVEALSNLRIRTSCDIGRVVFYLASLGLLGTRENESSDDFIDLLNFEKAFQNV